MAATALFLAYAGASHYQAHQSPFIATATPELVPQLTFTIDLPGDLPPQVKPIVAEPTSTPVPTLAPPTTPVVVAAAEATPVAIPAPTEAPSSGGVPWYVPAQWADRYLQCLERPDRFDVSIWIASVDWDIAEAHHVQGNEGADLCVFNYDGSGACGWFQLLPCPPDGLTPEGQIRAAYAKWLDPMCGDGGRSFYCHWYRFWVR